MRSVKYTTQFSRDLKREGKSPKNREISLKLQSIIDLLCEDQEVPVRLHDHALIGEFIGWRELHVKPDLLLLYRKVGEEAFLHTYGISYESAKPIIARIIVDQFANGR